VGVDIKAPEKAEEKEEKRELGVGGLLIIGLIIWALFPPKPPEPPPEPPPDEDEGVKPEVSVLSISWL
jgi:hypothetical protein